MSRSLIPNSTQIPDVILDHWMARLSGAEFKVVLYIARRTYGFGKDSDAISLNQMSRGIRTRSGVQLDYGTGLSRSSVKSACASLVQRGVLIKTQATVAGTEEPDENTYRLNLYAPVSLEEEPETKTESAPSSLTKMEVGQNLAHVGQKSAHLINPVEVGQNLAYVGQKLTQGGPEITQEVGQFLAPQETEQETDQQETAAAGTGALSEAQSESDKIAAAVLKEEKEESEETETLALSQALIAAGLNQTDALRLAQTRPEESHRQLEYLPFKTDLVNPGAYLRSAIEGGYAPPREYREAKAKEEREREVREEAQRKQAAKDRRMAQEAVEASRATNAMAWLEIESPAAFQDFLEYVESQRRTSETKYAAMPVTIQAKMRAAFDAPEQRRKLFREWEALAQTREGSERKSAAPTETLTPSSEDGDPARVAMLVTESLFAANR